VVAASRHNPNRTSILRNVVRAVLSVLIGLMVTLTTGRIGVYTGPDDPGIGPTTWWGLPIPFHETAPGGRVFGQWHYTFWFDVLFFSGIAFWFWTSHRQRE